MGLYEAFFMIFPVGVLVILYLMLMELREIRGSLRELVVEVQTRLDDSAHEP